MNIKKMYYKFILIIISLLTYACSGPKERFDPYKSIYGPKEYEDRVAMQRDGSLLKDLFLGKDKSTSNNNQSNNLNVNPFLWKASLSTLSSSMPLASIDSNSGIIISDWYNLKGKPNERVKISILVNTVELRSDGLNVKVFKQIFKGNSWMGVKVSPNIAINLERKIIQKAGMLSNQID